MRVSVLPGWLCAALLLVATVPSHAEEVAVESETSTGVITERVEAERADAFNPYVITAHKPNFIMPLSYTSDINESVYEVAGAPLREGLKSYEVNFQISLKSQINHDKLLFENDALYFGITIESWWQLYSPKLSSPFRETNYQPEIFYLTPLLWGPLNGRTAFMLGLEHQSNGQLQSLSRSWNRLYAALIYERGNFVGSIRPWYRLPEKAKESPESAEGDDNPDILEFLGHGELSLGWRSERLEVASRLHGNWSTGKGAINIAVSFPLHGKFRGMVSYFNGYGDSLIDYNRFQQRIGIGIALTNLF